MVDFHHLAVQLDPLGLIRCRRGRGERFVQFRVAVLAAIEKTVAGRPDRQVRVGIGPAAPNVVRAVTSASASPGSLPRIRTTSSRRPPVRCAVTACASVGGSGG
jgi:hypothetical protein